MTAFTQAQQNIRKTWLLMGGFFVFIILIGWGASYYFNNPEILYGSVIFSSFGNVFSFYFSDKVALSMSGAKKADKKNSEHRRAIRAVENMTLVARIPQPEVYIIEDSALNAFATGRGPKHAAIAVTTGLLKKLDKLELEGVIAHEMSHIKNRDILVMTVVVTLVGMVSMAADLAMRGAFKRKKDNQVNAIILIVGIIFVILSPIIAKIIQLSISRKREFLADASGVELTRHPQGLADALRKIGQAGGKVKRAGTATAHLYISNPFGDESKTKVNFLERIFSTHPPIEERISALNKMTQKVS